MLEYVSFSQLPPFNISWLLEILYTWKATGWGRLHLVYERATKPLKKSTLLWVELYFSWIHGHTQTVLSAALWKWITSAFFKATFWPPTVLVFPNGQYLAKRLRWPSVASEPRQDQSNAPNWILHFRVVDIFFKMQNNLCSLHSFLT